MCSIFAVSDDDANAIYTGCLVETQEDSITMVAIDGYRLAKRSYHDKEAVFPDMSFVIPSAALKELEKILSDIAFNAGGGDAPEIEVKVNAEYVSRQLEKAARDSDLNRFII